MANKKSILIILIPLIGILTFPSSCKKQTVEKTIVQQDTIIRHDTVRYSYTAIEQYNSGHCSELCSLMYIQTVGTWVNSRVIYSLMIPNLKQGDILSVFAEEEVTLSSTQYNYDAGVFSKLILGNTQTDLPNSSGITPISETNGEFALQNEHHHVIHQSGSYVCPNNLGNKYVNFCAYAETPNSSPGDTLQVNQCYGRLSIIVYRK